MSAAIVLPIGAVVAAGAVASSGRIATTTRQGLIVATVTVIPLAALVAVVFIDLVSGGDTHLTRTVLDAGGAGDLADTAERRLRLSADDFAQAAENPLFWLVVAGLVAGITQWRRIDAWLAPSPHARAGLVGACAAVAVGMLVNDSGATFLTLGGLALGAVVAYACAQARRAPPRAAGCRSGK